MHTPVEQSVVCTKEDPGFTVVTKRRRRGKTALVTAVSWNSVIVPFFWNNSIVSDLIDCYWNLRIFLVIAQYCIRELNTHVDTAWKLEFNSNNYHWPTDQLTDRCIWESMFFYWMGFLTDVSSFFPIERFLLESWFFFFSHFREFFVANRIKTKNVPSILDLEMEDHAFYKIFLWWTS